MKIIVTGGAGFIGSHVVEAYLQAGHQVLVLDNLSSGQEKNIPPAAEFIETDIRADKVKEIFATFKPDVVNHHAAQISVTKSVREPQLDAQSNVVGTIQLLEYAKQLSVKKFIFASSGGAIFGSKKPPFSEKSQPRPISPYGVSKLAAEEYIKYFRRTKAFKTVILRYANVYGPRQSIAGESGVISLFTDRLLNNQQPVVYGDGTQTRDYVYVGDVTRANVLALGADKSSLLHIGTGKERSTLQVFQTVSGAVGSTLQPIYRPTRDGEVQHSALQINKAKEVLGWQPETEFSDGIKKTVNWYREQT